MESTEKVGFMEGAKRLQKVLDRFIRAHQPAEQEEPRDLTDAEPTAEEREGWEAQ